MTFPEPDSATSHTCGPRWFSITPGCPVEVLASFRLFALGSHCGFKHRPQEQRGGPTEVWGRHVGRSPDEASLTAPACLFLLLSDVGRAPQGCCFCGRLCLSVVHVLSSAGLGQPRSHAPHIACDAVKDLGFFRNVYPRYIQKCRLLPVPWRRESTGHTHTHTGIWTPWRRP